MTATAARTTIAATVVLFAGLASVGRAQTSDTTAVKDDARTAGHAVAHGATTLGHSVAEKSRTARDTVRDDSKKAGHSMAEAARKVGRAVHDGFNRAKAGLSGKPSHPDPKG